MDDSNPLRPLRPLDWFQAFGLGGGGHRSVLGFRFVFLLPVIVVIVDLELLYLVHSVGVVGPFMVSIIVTISHVDIVILIELDVID